MRARQPSPVVGWLVLVLAAVTGYVAWQVAPLTARMDAVERVSTPRRMICSRRSSRSLGSSRRSGGTSPLSPSVAPAPPPSETPPPRVRPPGPSQSATTSPPSAGLAFLDRHLLPSDAAIARMMVGNAAAPDIARATHHSVAFVLARGRQIEEMLATARDAPPDLLRAIRDYLKEKRPPQSPSRSGRS